MTHLKLLQIISEELRRAQFSEYRTYSQETPAGKGEVSAGQPPVSKPVAKKQEDDIEGYVDELPVNLDKSTAIQRYDQEEIETEEDVDELDFDDFFLNFTIKYFSINSKGT